MPQWIEIAIRSISIILGLFLITKLLGKKQLSKLSFFEYIVGITVGDIAGTLSMDPDLVIKNGVTSILIWSLFPLLISRISLKYKGFRDLIEGNATVFVENGKILEQNLRKETYSIDEFMEQLRKKNIFNIDDIEFATLEPNGDFSVLLKKEKQPITYGDLFSDSPHIKEPQTVIMDGDILDEPLTKLGLSRGWLKAQLEKQQVLLESVFVAQVDSLGRVSIDLYDDQSKPPKMKEREFVLLTLEKCVADFSYLEATTSTEKQKDVYRNIGAELKNIKRTLHPLLKG
ncbi:DUF421 domain-containing protein [Sutcliffiella halmapala]|uniref:DUF421 domain-containing protein n=1 Tax=Sutcliffiella halmapala TaxID=79882 RepID=UPI0009950612|nr:DUF421 domain-containing protein [Sutcliffiella halmapala]